jgi:hypothetical protein
MKTLKQTEAEVLADERAAVERRLTARGRAFRRWFPPARVVEPDHFQWRSLADLLPVEDER